MFPLSLSLTQSSFSQTLYIVAEIKPVSFVPLFFSKSQTWTENKQNQQITKPNQINISSTTDLFRFCKSMLIFACALEILSISLSLSFYLFSRFYYILLFVLQKRKKPALISGLNAWLDVKWLIIRRIIRSTLPPHTRTHTHIHMQMHVWSCDIPLSDLKITWHIRQQNAYWKIIHSFKLDSIHFNLICISIRMGIKLEWMRVCARVFCCLLHDNWIIIERI